MAWWSRPWKAVSLRDPCVLVAGYILTSPGSAFAWVCTPFSILILSCEHRLPDRRLCLDWVLSFLIIVFLLPSFIRAAKLVSTVFQGGSRCAHMEPSGRGFRSWPRLAQTSGFHLLFSAMNRSVVCVSSGYDRSCAVSG